jgi:signal transduction histidine kinase
MTAHSYGGTGLGLADWKLAQLMGGDLRLESTQAPGTTVLDFAAGNFRRPLMRC